nr:DUF1570 domain-containing protein [Paludisphaera mucosa]
MLEEDLRHEAAHALLRGRFGDIPLWVDEGLAEYFEDGPDDLRDRGDRLARLAADVKAGWKPDLRRLETLDEVHQMDPRDYRESWAWVDLLLSDSKQGKPLLLDYLQARGPRPALSDALAAEGTDGARLLAHLNGEPARVVAQKPTAEEPLPDRVVRLQDRATDPVLAVPEPRRPGLLRRIGSFLGF